jgi:hypothetical protein
LEKKVNFLVIEGLKCQIKEIMGDAFQLLQ